MTQITGKEVDKLIRMKNKDTALTRKLKDQKAITAEFEDELIKKFTAGTSRVDGKLGSATLNETVMGSVKDWDKVYKYILKNKRFDLLEKRLGQAMYRELIEDGVKIAGIEKFRKKTLGIGRKRGIK